MAKSAPKKGQTDYCKKVEYKVNFKCLALCLRLRHLHGWSEISTEVFLTTILFTLKNYIPQCKSLIINTSF